MPLRQLEATLAALPPAWPILIASALGWGVVAALAQLAAALWRLAAGA